MNGFRIDASAAASAGYFVGSPPGVPADQFVELFPGVMLEQARAVLEHAARSALPTA